MGFEEDYCGLLYRCRIRSIWYLLWSEIWTSLFFRSTFPIDHLFS